LNTETGFQVESFHDAATTSADRLIARVQALSLQLAWLLETHVHADHLSAAACPQSQLGGEIVISEHITAVQQMFGGILRRPRLRMASRQVDIIYIVAHYFRAWKALAIAILGTALFVQARW
jgi:glyoxylase-like metal-dependent hydrolase (beta-lactamase superfamily II)